MPTKPTRLALVGVGNNVSALLQGIEMYGAQSASDVHVGIRREILDDFAVSDVRVVAAFDIAPEKIGATVSEAIFRPPNNFPRIASLSMSPDVVVEAGLRPDDLSEQRLAGIAKRLLKANAEVVLLSLPTGRVDVAVAYAQAALAGGAAVVNCSADPVARNKELLRDFAHSGLPLLGDDLASQFGSSLIHRALLGLVKLRGLQVDGTHQINVGGNEDFRNLRDHGERKLESKLNVLSPGLGEGASLTVIPSGGYIKHLQDRKVAYVSIEGKGWAGARFSLELRLEVQDSANAAGVIIDLIRIAGGGRRRAQGGFIPTAAELLKSPPA